MVQIISEASFPNAVIRVEESDEKMLQVSESETQRLANLFTLMQPKDGGRSILVSRVAGFAGLFLLFRR